MGCGVVGGGHNGLTCAAYLARAGKQVLVLEKRDRVGGACTIEEPWPGVRVSPCAYLAGLLHPLVVEELDLPALGFSWFPAINGLFLPFEDGASVQLYEDDEQCEAEIARLCPHDVSGWRAMSHLISRTRDSLRPANENDLWIGEPPTREQIERRLGKDNEAYKLLFEWSMADLVERYLSDERLQAGYLGQGVIGTNASPFDPGTASIRFIIPPAGWAVFLACGVMSKEAWAWCHSTSREPRKAGAAIVTGIPVAHIIPAKESNSQAAKRSRTCCYCKRRSANRPATAGRTCRCSLAGQIAGIPMRGCTLKLNVWLRELPSFRARPGTLEQHHYGQINTPLRKQEWKENYAMRAQASSLHGSGRNSISKASTMTSPAGTHTMSVFAQYVPYEFANGDGPSSRSTPSPATPAICPQRLSNAKHWGRAILSSELVSPAAIFFKANACRLHVGQTFELPDADARILFVRSGDSPGGSVIAINGRNAAMAVIADSQRSVSASAAG